MSNPPPPPSASSSEAHVYNILPTKLKCKNRHAMIINCQFSFKIYWIKITADTPSTNKLLDETKIRLAAAICNINRKRQFFQWFWNLLRLRNSDVSPCKSRYQIEYWIMNKFRSISNKSRIFNKQDTNIY